MIETQVQFTLNGRAVSLVADDDRTLLWVPRTDLALTGPKYGCGEGICGACAVIIDHGAFQCGYRTSRHALRPSAQAADAWREPDRRGHLGRRETAPGSRRSIRTT